MTLSLSVLDLVPVSSGSTSARSLASSLELAQLVDRLGYARLWYAEHHNMPAIASTTPSILIALAAERTRGIRVGSGGVMLPNHAPLQVAEAFKLLEARYPGRVDLGIGRAPGTDTRTALALRGSRLALHADDFPEQLAELRAFGASDARAAVTAYPDDVALPPIWLLGSSNYSCDLAADLGLGYGFAAHFSPERPDRPMLSYRERFKPSTAFPRPHAILTLSVVCAETHEEAEYLALSMQLARARMNSGRFDKVPTPEDALAHSYTADERAAAQQYRGLQVVGTPAEARERIESIARRTQADEVMVTTVTHDPHARARSFTLLARAFELSERG